MDVDATISSLLNKYLGKTLEFFLSNQDADITDLLHLLCIRNEKGIKYKILSFQLCHGHSDNLMFLPTKQIM